MNYTATKGHVGNPKWQSRPAWFTGPPCSLEAPSCFHFYSGEHLEIESWSETTVSPGKNEQSRLAKLIRAPGWYVEGKLTGVVVPCREIIRVDGLLQILGNRPVGTGSKGTMTRLKLPVGKNRSDQPALRDDARSRVELEKMGSTSRLIKVGCLPRIKLRIFMRLFTLCAMNGNFRGQSIAKVILPCSTPSLPLPIGRTRSNLAPIISITINRLIKPMYSDCRGDWSPLTTQLEVKSLRVRRSSSHRFYSYPITFENFPIFSFFVAGYRGIDGKTIGIKIAQQERIIYI